MRLTLLTLASLVAAFYAEEDWRGKNAWNHTKREVESQGTSLEWSSYIPAAVPDNQNILKAPKMEEWFARKGGNELTRRLGTLYEFSTRASTNLLAIVAIASPGTSIPEGSADLVLRYRHGALTLDALAQPANGSATPGSAIIPLIVLDNVPLTDPITNLARQAGLRYSLDPTTGLRPGQPQPTVSVRWENVTADQALMAVLDTYALQWVENPQTGFARVVPSDPHGPKVSVSAAAGGRISQLLAKTLAEPETAPPTFLRGAQDLELASKPVPVARPLRLQVRSEEALKANQVSDFFATNALVSPVSSGGRLRVEPAGANVFHVFLGPPVHYTAAEYLAWSDQFTNDFAMTRAALTRPFARLDGDYSRPLEIPQPSFVTVRVMVQTLAQRAQCLLLLGRPEEALRELTLVHDLSRILDVKTGAGSITLLKAMINVAVTGVYVQAVGDGLRLRAWRQPQLLALQQQLEEIDLPPQLVAALRAEGAALCRTFEELGPRKTLRCELYSLAEPKQPDFWQRIKDARGAMMELAPRGWVYQNMKVAASLNQLTVDVFEPSTRTVSPQKVDGISIEFDKSLHRVTPQNFMAVITCPNFTRAWEVLAQNQTLASQAFVACALERHRLERGEYPETLNALVPKWASSLPQDVIGGQPLRYRRHQQGTFTLYSVGWNGRDEGGLAVTDPRGRPSLREGDWVWQ